MTPHPADPGRPGLRVATLNLASGRGHDGAVLAAGDLARSVSALAGPGGAAPDLVCLQEVDVAQPRSAGVDQAALVARALGAVDWRFAPALAGTPGPWRSWEPVDGRLVGPGPVSGDGTGPLYGIALLSRVPVASWHVLALGSGRGRLPLRAVDPRTGRAVWWAFPDEPRVAVAAVLADGAVVACTHLSFAPVTAVRQLRALRRWLAALPSPAGASAVRLLAGDLNLPGAVAARLAGGTALVREATYPASAPRLQLDHVLTVGAPVSGGGRVLALAGGDHRAVLAEVTPSGS